MEKRKELLVAQELMDKGEYKEGLLLLNDFEEKEEVTNEDLHSYYFLKSSLLLEIRNFKEAQKYAHLAYEESQKLGDNLKIVDTLILMSKVLVRQPNDCLNVVVRAENLIKTISPELGTNLKQKEASLAWVKSWAYFFNGDSIKSLKFAESSLKFQEEIGNKKSIISSLVQLGHIYTIYKGDMNRSLIFAERAMKIAEAIGNRSCRFNIAHNLRNLGNISALRGELNNALDYFKQSLAILEEFEDKGLIMGSLNNIALTHWRQGDLENALEVLEKNYTLNKEYGTPWLNSISLGNLVELNIERGDLEKANLYLRKLKELKNQEENEFINNMYSFSKAIMLKKSTRIRDQAKAEEIFKRIIEGETSTHSEVTINAIINLCDLLIAELRTSNNLEILDELEPLITQLLEISKTQHVFPILGEVYLLKAKIALITLDIKGARKLLSRAQEIAEKYGLNKLAMDISNEHDKLLNNLDIWENIKEPEVPLAKRMELARLGRQMDKMVKKSAIETPKLEVEQPVLFTIITKEGNILLSNPFTAEMTFDNTRLGKFLTFFNTFIDQIFSESFDRVKFGQYTVLITEVDSFSICYMFQGQTYSARQKIIHFTEVIKKDSNAMKILENSYNIGEVIKVNENPHFEEMITESFLSDPQKFRVPFKAYVGDEPFIFVSYSHTDKLQVYPIIDYLNKIGVNIWYDEGIPISENWKKSIVQNLERCQVFLVFITPYIIDSEMVRKEISFALKKKKKFTAVYLKQTKLPSELEFEIADIQALMKYRLTETEFYDKLKTMFDLVLLKSD